jgi:phosphatidylinositol alpha-1,6-mannosyltransferase
MRVLALLTDGFGGHGGIARYNRDLMTALAGADRISAAVSLTRSAGSMPGALPAGVTELGGGHGRAGYALRAMRLARGGGPWSAVLCGHLYMAPLAVLIARRLRVPCWLQLHGIEAWQAPSRLVRKAAEACDLVTAVSRFTRARFLRWAALDPVRVRVLPNTVSPEFEPGPKPAGLVARYGLAGRKVLLTVSRLAATERYKGQDRVIAALPAILARHPETVYLIAGDGDDRPRLEALAAQAGVSGRVIFAGRVPHAELPGHYRLADAFVMPSTGEGFGIAFLEAAASGVHVIGGNQDGSADALADGAIGRVIAPDDRGQLIEALCDALGREPPRVDLAGRFGRAQFAGHVAHLVDAIAELAPTTKDAAP